MAALLAVLGLCATVPARAVVDAHVDRNPVGRDESLRLTVEADVSGDPDFSALEADFEILGRSQRSNLSLANGRLTRTQTWIVNLMPRRTGTITIAPIRVGAQSTDPIILQVRDTPSEPGADAQDLFLVASAKPLAPYVQQQVVYTVQLWRRAEIQDTDLSEPRVEGGTALIRTLGDDRNFRAERDGVSYQVVERRYTVFPQTSGTLTLAPLELTTQVVKGVSSFFDPFAHDMVTRRLRTSPIALNVKPVPAAFKGKIWLPARKIDLKEVWSDDRARIEAGEPVSRTVALIADGLTAGQLPELLGAGTGDFKVYPEQPQLTDQATEDGVIAVRQEKVALIANRAGRLLVPALEVPWWNVDTDRAQIARLSERRLQVVGEDGSPAPAADAAPAGELMQPMPSATWPAAAGKTPGAEKRWRTIAGAAIAVWLATIAAWLWSARRHRRGGARASVPESSAAVAWRALRKAADRADAAGTRAAVLGWARAQWPQAPPNSLPEVARRCGPPLAAPLLALDAALYAPGAKTWDAGALRAALARHPRDPRETAPPARASTLQPLHPG